MKVSEIAERIREVVEVDKAYVETALVVLRKVEEVLDINNEAEKVAKEVMRLVEKGVLNEKEAKAILARNKKINGEKKRIEVNPEEVRSIQFVRGMVRKTTELLEELKR
ncbi:MAG: hypothetical protein OCU22_07670 [Canidatus Methanoxibalbensis ujae]|nr:hypothetical protein [Candidatus Methanoxibalbensis ujae]